MGIWIAHIGVFDHICPYNDGYIMTRSDKDSTRKIGTPGKEGQIVYVIDIPGKICEHGNEDLKATLEGMTYSKNSMSNVQSCKPNLIRLENKLIQKVIKTIQSQALRGEQFMLVVSHDLARLHQ